jgi:hypothetical protein
VQLVYERGYSAPDDESAVAFADHECALAEADEDNNKSAAATVPVHEPTPDLAIEAVTVDPPAIAAGEGVTLTITVKNVGDGAADGASRVGVYVDESFSGCASEPSAGWFSVPALLAGQTSVLEVKVDAGFFDPAADPHEIMLLEDYSCSGRIEIGTDNNRFGPLEVRAKWRPPVPPPAIPSPTRCGSATAGRRRRRRTSRSRSSSRLIRTFVASHPQMGPRWRRRWPRARTSTS